MRYYFRNNRIILIGDTHDTTSVHNILNIDIPDGNDVLHVGDVGLGFGFPDLAMENAGEWLRRFNNLCKTLDINLFLTIGNHDNPEVWKFPNQSNVFMLKSGDVGIFPNGKKALLIGGGLSVDRFKRTEGFDYWRDEVTPRLDTVEKCDIMFSHDCPEHFNHSTKSLPSNYGWYCERDVTLIDDALKQRLNMSDIVKRSGIKTMFYGHMHNTLCQNVDGVYARCLDINERYEFDAEKDYCL